MNTVNRSILSGMQIPYEQKWLQNQAVVVENNLIKAIVPIDMIEHHLPAKHYKFSIDDYLSPGFIDIHIHGTHGKDVMDGTMESLLVISESLAAEGVTGFLATTMNAEDEHIDHVLKTIATAMEEDHTRGAAILGVHLEGTFISKAKMGAQRNIESLPHFSFLRRWQDCARGAIKIVTFAPELPHAAEFIKEALALNILVSIGHTDATYEETNAAIAVGCTQATHLFNAMSGMHQRKPGAVSALLLANQVSAEIIVDGIHLHPAIVEIILYLKHKERLLLVTDAIRAKCLGNGEYELGGQKVRVKDGECLLPNGTLAGSTLRMPKAIKNMMEFTKCSLIDALQMATANPARVLGIDDRKGSITVGKDADLVVLSKNLDVKLTMRGGEVCYMVK